MNKIISLVEEARLTSASAVESTVLRGPLKGVLELRDRLVSVFRGSFQSLVLAQSVTDPDPFNFVASRSIRGDGACILWECRLRKIRLLARYAALYCDKVFVPLCLPWDEVEGQDSWALRYVLAGTLLSVLELRPLVEAGIVDFIPDQLYLCGDHLREFVPSQPRIGHVRRSLVRKHLGDFRIDYHPPSEKARFPSAHIAGPVEFVEHGKTIHIFEKVPGWAPQLTGNRLTDQSVRLSRSMVLRSGLIDSIFGEMAGDLCLQQFYGLRSSARYLTDLPGEAEFLRAVASEDYVETQTAALCAKLTHTVPLFTDVPIHAVMRIRKDDHEPFLVYRNALTSIVRDYVKTKKRVGEREARQIYTDILLPEVTKLSAQARAKSRASWRKFGIKAGVSGLVITLGVFGGLLPAELAGLFKTIGGFGLLKEIGEALASIEKNPGEIRDHNLYFLLRLRGQGRGQRKAA